MELNKTLWNKWQSDWSWIMSIAETRNWDYSKIVIKDPIALEEIKTLEKSLDIELPSDFKHVLCEYSSGIDLNWHMDDDEIESFEAIFCGGSDGILWDFSQLDRMYKNYLDWVAKCFPDPNNEYDKIWHNKIPFLEVGNGDMIVFDRVSTENGCPVIFLSHDGSDFHGSHLADSFIEFITNWSNIGCVGTEDWILEIFYDSDSKKLMSESSVINEWKQALTKA